MIVFKNVPTRTTSIKGFTLVEMMVVIAIIGILSVVVYASFSQARMQARDKIRQGQLEQLQVAIELYKDKYGRYPASGCSTPVGQWSGPIGDQDWNTTCSDYIVGHTAGAVFVPEFIDRLPVDPSNFTNIGNNIFYRTDAGGTTYQVLHHMTVETLFVDNKSHPLARYTGSGCSTPLQPNSYVVYSAGAAECW